MESPYDGGASAPVISHVSSSRPSIGFPLGTALLLLVIFSLSGVFSCCYHWDKLRRSFSLNPTDANEIPSKIKILHKHQENQGLPVIIMPGDNVPKFIAMPCPCEPSRLEKIIVEVQKPPILPSPKPPISCSNQQYNRDI